MDNDYDSDVVYSSTPTSPATSSPSSPVGVVVWVENILNGTSWAPHLILDLASTTSSFPSFPIPISVIHGAAIADFNGDAVPDILLTQQGAEMFYLPGPFPPHDVNASRVVVEADPEKVPRRVIVGDVLARGINDIVASDTGDRVLAHYVGDESTPGAFHPRVVFGTSVIMGHPGATVLGSFSGSPRLDLLGSEVFLNLALWIATPAAEYYSTNTLESQPDRLISYLTAADANNDGLTDIAYVSTSLLGTDVSIQTLLSQPADPSYFASGSLPLLNLNFAVYRTEFRDVNGDLQDDFIVGSSVVGLSLISFVPNTLIVDYITIVAFVPGSIDFILADTDHNGLFTAVVITSNSIFVSRPLDRRYVLFAPEEPKQYPLLVFHALDSCDLDGDNDIDLVIATSTGLIAVKRRSSLFAYDSDAIELISSPDPITFVQIVDANNDDAPDVIYASATSLFLATGSKASPTNMTTFALASSVVVDPAASSLQIQLGDIDNDGDLDAVILSSSSGVIYALTLDSSTPTGTLSPTPVVLFTPSGYVSPSHAVADTNNDGTLDVLFAFAATNIRVLVNDPSNPGTFLPVTITPFTISWGTSLDGLIMAGSVRSQGVPSIFYVMGSVLYVQASVPFGETSARTPVVYTTSDPPVVHRAFSTKSSPCSRFQPGGGKSIGCINHLLAVTSPCVRDTFHLAPGTYVGCNQKFHTFFDRRVHLVGAPNGTTHIDCAPLGGGSLYKLRSTKYGSQSGLILENIHISGMTLTTEPASSSGGIRVSDQGSYLVLLSSSSISNSSPSSSLSSSSSPSAIGNTIYDGPGAAILVRSGGMVHIAGPSLLSAPDKDPLVLSHNVAGEASGGGAVGVTGVDSRLCVDGNVVFSSNTAVDGDGGALSAILSGSIELYGTRVENNTAGRNGGGIGISASALLRMHAQTRVEGNSASGSGGGIALDDGGEATFEDATSQVRNNHASQAGGGVFVSGGALLSAPAGGVMRGNTGARYGGGLGVVSPGRVESAHLVIHDNVAGVGGGVAAVSPGATLSLLGAVSRADLVAVVGDDRAGGVEPSLVLSGADVARNEATMYGSAVAGCGAVVDVVGTSMEGDVFVCIPSYVQDSGVPLPPPGASGEEGENSIPWVRNLPSGTTDVSSPPLTLTWITPPAAVLPPGQTLDGSLVAVDVFGAEIADDAVVLLIEVSRPGGGDSTSGDDGIGFSLLGPVTAGGSGESPVLELPELVVLASDGVNLPVGGIEAKVGFESRTGTMVDFSPRLVAEARFELGLCPPGFGGSVAQSPFVCSLCGEGTYSTENSVTPCKACPKNAGLISDDGRGTGSLVGNTTTTTNSSTTSSSSGGIENLFSACPCLPGYYALDTTVDPASPTGVCAPCPLGGRCEGGSTGVPVAVAGFFEHPPGSGSFFRCARDGCGGSGCLDGYQGFMCGTCRSGWYPANERRCDVCGPVSVVFLVLGVLGVVVFVAVLGLVVGLGLASRRPVLVAGGGEEGVERIRQERIGVSLGLWLFGLQTMGLMGQLDVAWPVSVQRMLDVVQLVNLGGQGMGLYCVTGSFHGMYALSLVLYGCIGMGVLGVVLGLRVVGKMFRVWRLEGLWRASPRWMMESVACVLGPVMYIPVSYGTMLVFDCSRSPNGDLVLDADSSVTCFEGLWWVSAALGTVVFLGFVVGFPVGVGYLLWSRKPELCLVQTMFSMGLLYQNWVPSFWYGEVVGLVRRGLVVGAVVALSRYPVIVFMALVSSSVPWIMYVVLSQPYYIRFYNRLDSVGTTFVVGVLLCALCAYAERDGEGEGDALIFVAVLFCVVGWAVFGLVSVVADVRSMARERREEEWRGGGKGRGVELEGVEVWGGDGVEGVGGGLVAMI